MIELVDTHCHIQSAGNPVGERSTGELWARDPDLTAAGLIEQAAAEGVTRLICVGCELNDSKLAVEFVQNQPGAWASIGIHPHEAKLYADQPELLKEFAALAIQPKVVAVGECGLDYFYEHSPKAEQVKLLHHQLQLAKEHNLPVIFHVREAFDDFWPIFDNFKGLTGVIHSFSANTQYLEQILSRGLYVGLNGIMTFTKDENQLAAAMALPLESMLLETDAPFLTPTPERGTICKPKHVVLTAEFLAGLRDESVEQLATVTTQNACNLFGLK